MTIICALDTGNGIIIGSDTQSIAMGDFGGRRMTHGPKWTVSKPWALGVAGQSRMQCLIQRNMADIIQAVPSALEVCDRLQDMFSRYGVNASSQIGALDCGSNFILASPHGVYDIDSCLSVRKAAVGELIASGSGASYALGAAHALETVDDITAHGIVKRSLEAAIAFDTGCGGEPWLQTLETGP